MKREYVTCTSLCPVAPKCIWNFDLVDSFQLSIIFVIKKIIVASTVMLNNKADYFTQPGNCSHIVIIM